MKKIFNLAFVVASFMGAAVFTSCDKEDKEDNIEDAFEDGDTDVIMESESLSVVPNQKYAAYNPSINGGTLNFTVLTVTGEAGSKVVTFKVELKGDDANGETFELGDDKDHTSYFGRIDGKLQACNQATAEKNAANVIFALSSEANNYLITSATVNAKVGAAGAKETRFGTYVNKK